MSTDYKVEQAKDAVRENNEPRQVGEKMLDEVHKTGDVALKAYASLINPEEANRKLEQEGLLPVADKVMDVVAVAKAQETMRLKGVSEHVATIADARVFEAINTGEGINKIKAREGAAAEAASREAEAREDADAAEESARKGANLHDYNPEPGKKQLA